MTHKLRPFAAIFAALTLFLALVLTGIQSLTAQAQPVIPTGTDPVQTKTSSSDDAEILQNQVFVEYTFEAPVVERMAEYDRVTIPGLNSHGEPGAPILPFQTARILLPHGTDLERIEVVSSDRVTLDGSYLVEPGQHLRPTDSVAVSVRTPPDPGIYGSAKPFPGRLYTQVSVQTLAGYTILFVQLHPVQHVPETGQIFYHEYIEVTVSTADRAEIAEAQERMLRSVASDAARVQSIVDNPDVVGTYGAVGRGTAQPQTSLVDPADPNDYILITSNALSTSFQPLVDWKTTKGLAASIVTIEDIYANYSGTDNPDRIRNFIIDAYTAWAPSDHPLQYVVLGGDDEIIPVRYLYEPGSGSPSAGGWMPSDMYYAGLDGNWDADGDGLYGEDANSGAAGEECDFFAEVYVGRMTVDTTAEATHIVSKTLSYEQNPGADSFNRALLIGRQLDSITWGGNFKDTVAELIPQYNVTALYQRDGTFSVEGILAKMNTGTHLVNFDGHGEWNCCPLGSSQVDSLINSEYFLFANLGCNTAAFDQDVSGDSEAVAEHYIYNEHGAFAYIGNTRYGWYAPGSTSGASEGLDRLFFDTVVNSDVHNVGKALQIAKEDYYNQYLRFAILTMILLGDPETSIITEFLSPIGDITSPAGGNTLKNKVNIIGVAQAGQEAGATFDHYEVEYGMGIAPTSWTQIGPTSYTPVTSGTLAVDWDTTVLTDGVYTIRLTVDDGSGRIGQDQAVVNLDNVYITYPPEGNFHRAGDIITVTGTAQGTDFQNYVLEYGRGKSPTDWTWIGSSTVPVTDGVLVVWDTGAIGEAAYYTLRLTMNGTGHVTTDMVTLYIDATFQDGWPRSVIEWITAPSLAIGDIDGDGDMELVTANYGHVYAWHHDGTLVEGWPLDCWANRRSSPALADLDRDGDLEIIFGHNVRVEAWQHDGSWVTGWPRGTGGYVDSSPAVEDLDGDGFLEVAAGSQDGNVYVWHHNGTAANGWPQAVGEVVDASPALGDIDGDGDREVVVGVSDGAVHAWHHDGTTVSGWPVTRPAVWAAASSPALGDIDGDGDIEIVVGGDRVDAWHHDGTTVSGWPQYVGWPSDSSPALGDMDGDGDLEILFGSDQVYAWHGDGTVVAGWPVALDYTLSSPVLGDIDGDGDPEVLINSSYSDGWLQAWHHNGSTVTGWPRAIPPGDMSMSSPILEDLDQDGDIEVAIGVEGQVLVWDLPGVYDEANLEWKMFHHDLWHTGFYPPTSPPRVSVDPPVSEVGVGAQGTVHVRSDGLSNIYGAQFTLSFDPAHLQVVDADPGEGGIQITPGICPAEGFVPTNTADNTNGTVHYAVTQLAPTPPCNGGPISMIDFLCLDTGSTEPITTSILITESIVADPDGIPIPHSVQHGEIVCKPGLTIEGYAIIDQSYGDGDGIMDCGETIELYVTLRNVGEGSASGLNACIEISDPYVTILYNTCSDYPDITGGEMGTNSDGFDLEVDSSIPDGHVVHFNLNITAADGGAWSDSFDVTAACGASLVEAVASSALESWPVSNVLAPDGTWSSRGHREHLVAAEWVAGLMGAPATISRVRLTPREGGGTTLGFPSSFVLQYSYQGGNHTCDPAATRFREAGNWLPLLTFTNYPQPLPGPIDYDFPEVTAECVRVFGTDLSQDDYGNRYFQLTQLEAFQDGAKLDFVEAVASSALASWLASNVLAPDGTWSSRGHREHLVAAEWVAGLMGAPATISRVRLTPREGGGTTLGFPSSFVLQYSYQGGNHTCDPAATRFREAGNWLPLLTFTNYAQPSPGPIDYGFPEVTAECVRVFGTDLSQDDYGNRYFQLTQLEAFQDGAKLDFVEAVASSALGSWPVSNVLAPDGTWSSRGHREHLVAAEWVAGLMGAPATISRVRLTPRERWGTTLGFPSSFVLQYSYQGGNHTCDPAATRFREAGNWLPLLTFTNYPQPLPGPMDYDFSEVTAECVRVFGTDLSQDDYGNRYFQLTQLEAYR